MDVVFFFFFNNNNHTTRTEMNVRDNDVSNNYKIGKNQNIKWSPHSIEAKMLDCNSIASRFEFQSHYYIHFQTNTFGKGVNSFISPSYRLNSPTSVLQH